MGRRRADVSSHANAQVDNNAGRDFELELVDAPTEEQVLERRAAAYEAAEKARQEAIDAAEAELQVRRSIVHCLDSMGPSLQSLATSLETPTSIDIPQGIPLHVSDSSYDSI